jgi:putative addiction module component (TIGR02574 family)
MARALEELFQEAMALSPEERLQLSQQIYDSLMTDEEREIEEAWLDEVERRYADYEAGRTKTIPGEQVFRELREKYAGQDVRTRR